jgi:hypothetical protein
MFLIKEHTFIKIIKKCINKEYRDYIEDIQFTNLFQMIKAFIKPLF